MPITFEKSLDDIAVLVKQFKTNRSAYLAAGYKEMHARQELIDPLFIALGWDVHNSQHFAPDYREVILEDSLDIEGQSKAPDYAFRVGKERKFFVEAKKPGVDLKGSPAPAYQLRRYAWTAKLPLSVLTDFEELAIYDCRQRPSDKDKVTVGRINYLTYEMYADQWRSIWDVFSREAVLQGSFDQYAQSSKSKRGTSEVDAVFLQEIESWREALARNIAQRNTTIGIEALNDAVQRIIDRIIFLRMAEDKGVEQYGRLQNLTNGTAIYKGLLNLSKQADAKYNSGLFDFSKAGDTVTPNLTIDDKALKPILSGLYFPQSPYQFSVLPVEILGNVYEQFLGKVIRLTSSHQAKVEEKPEVKKAGGVYYTPAYIVDYIVKNTVGKLVEGKSPRQLEGFRVLDPACGSGSFLLGAYQYLLDYYLGWYSGHEPEKLATRKAGPIYKAEAGTQQPTVWRLTTAEKKRILTAHIYGVDIDRQAVEVTKLSLLLKVLETESGDSLSQQLTLIDDEAKERVLPNLDKNIKCGNSLIGPDYFTEQLLSNPDELRRVNAFDWLREFPEAMKAGGFDCVIGNPPYIRIQVMKEWAPLEVEIYKELYQAASVGNYDIYVVFVEKGLNLLNKNGRLGYILPHKFFDAQYGEALRNVISQGCHLADVVHFGDQQIFVGATTYTCLMFLDKAGATECHFAKVANLIDWRNTGESSQSTILAKDITSSAWGFARNTSLGFSNKQGKVVELNTCAHVFQGLATSADSVYVLELIRQEGKLTTVRSRELDSQEFKIESDILHPLLKGAEISRYSEPSYANVVLFPYRLEDQKAILLTEKDFRRNYPLAFEYLSKTKNKLLSRSKVDPKVFWHFPYPKNLSLYERPKLIVQVLSTRGNFALDEEGKYYFLGGGTAGGNAIRVEDDNLDSYQYLLGVLNSKFATYHVKRVGSTFRGGYFAFGKGSIGSLPIRLLSLANNDESKVRDRMIALVGSMLELHKQRAGVKDERERELYQRQIDATDAKIDALVYELYGLTAEEIAIVEGEGSGSTNGFA